MEAKILTLRIEDHYCIHVFGNIEIVGIARKDLLDRSLSLGRLLGRMKDTVCPGDNCFFVR